MKISATSSAAVLQDLAAWCQLAHDVLQKSQQPQDAAVVRVAKQQLRRHHARHLTQLREWLGRRKSGGRFARKQTEAWAEVIHVMQARNDYVAVAACALLERAVLVAYERALDHLWLENTAIRLLRRQRLMLKYCHARYLRRPSTARHHRARAHTARPAASLGAMAAFAAAS